VRPTVQPSKDRLGFMELILDQPGDGGADAGLALEALDFQHLPFGFGLGAGGDIFTDALTVLRVTSSPMVFRRPVVLSGAAAERFGGRRS